jgi:hypothetical protein
VAVYCYCAGALVAALGVAHLVAIVLAAIDQGRRQEFVYTFRFYALLQLGVLLVAFGTMAAVRAPRLAPGERAAWRSSFLAWAAILTINLPLVPLQGFAVLFSSLAVLALLCLAVSGGHVKAVSAPAASPCPPARLLGG